MYSNFFSIENYHTDENDNVNVNDSDSVAISIDLEANNNSSRLQGEYTKSFLTENNFELTEHGSSGSNNILTTICNFAINKYGPPFCSMVKNMLPFMVKSDPHEIVTSDEFVHYIMDNIDLELGYTKKELEMLNDPIIEFVSTLPTKELGQEDKRKAIGIFNNRINSVLDYFYKELKDDCEVY
jgi:hypothetical protein